MPHDPDFPGFEDDLDATPDALDFDAQDLLDAAADVEFRALMTGLPARPGTRR